MGGRSEDFGVCRRLLSTDHGGDIGRRGLLDDGEVQNDCSKAMSGLSV